MGKMMDRDPLLAPPPPEVRLQNAPLISVLSQVRFPAILAIDHSKEDLVRFQEFIRGKYPFSWSDKRISILT